MRTNISRWGNSLAMRIPRSVADRLGLNEGARVELSVEDCRLVVKPLVTEPRLEELLKGITSDNLPESFDGPAIGSEAL